MIPKGWDSISLSNLFRKSGYCKDGDWIESKDQDPNGDVRLIQLADIGDGYFINKSSRFLTTEKASKLKCTFINHGDILVARMPEPLGRACIFPGVGQKAVTAVDVCIIKPDSDFDTKWLMFALNNPIFRDIISSKATGTTRTRISRKNLLSLYLYIPPLPEQKRIAEILTSVDDAIEATKKVIEQSKKVKQGLMQELLNRGIGHSKFKKTEIGEIPESWEVVSIGQVLESTTYGINLALCDNFLLTPVLRMGNIQNNSLYLKNLKYCDVSGLNKKKTFLMRNDILFNRTNSYDLVGKVALVNTDDSLSYASYLVRLRTNKYADAAWLAEMLGSESMQSRLKSIATLGVSQCNINPTKMRSLKIPLPPKPEQRRFVAIFEGLNDSLLSNSNDILKLQKLKSGLMQDLLTGRVRVGDVE